MFQEASERGITAKLCNPIRITINAKTPDRILLPSQSFRSLISYLSLHTSISRYTRQHE